MAVEGDGVFPVNAARLPNESSNEADGNATAKARQRKWAPKVTTGCFTCRVKCDEQKPVCKKCTASGRSCAYENKTQRTQPPVLAPKPARAILTEPQFCVHPSQLTLSWEEIQSFRYFRQVGAKQVGGAFDQQLWNRALLQAARWHPSIWYACIALSASYQMAALGDSHDPSRAAAKKRLLVGALERHSEAINHLIQTASKTSLNRMEKEMVLMASIMLALTSRTCRNTTEMLQHSTRGIELFHQWKLWDNKGQEPADTLFCVRSFVAAFARLDAQTIAFRPVPFNVNSWASVMESPLMSPDSFQSPTDAYYALEPIYAGIWGLTVSVSYKQSVRGPSKLRLAPDDWHVYRRALRAWKSRYDDLERSDRVTPADRRAMAILKIRHTFTKLTLAVDLSQPALREMCYDAYIPEIKKIMHMCAELLEMRSDGNEELPQVLLTFGPSVYEPLFGYARIIRVPDVRRELIRLLRKCPPVEGVMDTNIAANLAEYTMNFEESRAWPDPGAAAEEKVQGCTCVPWKFMCLRHRVVESHRDYGKGDGKPVRIFVRRICDMEAGGRWHEVDYGVR